ncbi:phage tail protein [Ectopseudomonas mendocina]|uniref:Phage tail protein n=1 Tax=Ectopseudomonas mendocina TaxID=300 RepID=A0A2R3QPD3_ECTME|nr:phage tail protein [Pseudomonas mendocina]AVO53639.1 hypothetical protein C7A17_12955 [Pseudomonas mendocina]
MEKIGAYTERATESGEWRSGNPATGQQATPMLASYFNMVQRELVQVVESAGIELDKDDDSQLLQAIRRLRGGAATNFGQWLWSSSTAGNPGAGRIALNNATPGSATTLFIEEISAEDVDFAQSLGLLRAGDTITLQERDTAELSHRLRVTGLAVDHGTYRSIPVDYVSGSGGLPEADAIVSVLLTQAGASDASIPLFMAQWWPNRASIPAGYAPADGQLLSRATFPDAWAGIQAGNVPSVADATWLSTATERGKYTAGDGSTSFRLPDYNGKAAGSLGAVFMRGDGALSAAVAGAIQASQMMDHRHATAEFTAGRLGNSTAATGPSQSGLGVTSNDTNVRELMLTSSAVYAGAHGAPSVGAETRPLNVTGCWIIKIFGSVTNPGSADAAQLASDYAALVGRVAALETRPRGLGDGQTWQDVTASRAIGTIYTNTTGRSIEVLIGASSDGNSRLTAQVGSLPEFGNQSYAAPGTDMVSVSFVVPNGWTYRLNSLTGTLLWLEMRT